MDANPDQLTSVPRSAKVRVPGVRGMVVAMALLFAGAAAAQTAVSPTQRSAQHYSAQRAANDLSPATIRMLQHSLIQGGYAIDAADGVWGPKTEAAVRDFQRVKGLEPTGRPDPQTLTALGVSAEGSANRAGRGEPGAGEKLPQVRARTPADLDRTTIRAIQQALDQQGMQVGLADGVWGEQTTTAIANLQRAHGLPASGEPDAYTLTILGLLPGGAKRAEAWRSGELPRPADLDPAAIRLIQQSLRARGFTVGLVDGVWGDRTVSALRDFQRAEGLEVVGEPDVYTLSALGLLPAKEAAPSAVRRHRQ